MYQNDWKAVAERVLELYAEKYAVIRYRTGSLVIHHEDGDRRNNRIENIILVTREEYSYIFRWIKGNSGRAFTKEMVKWLRESKEGNFNKLPHDFDPLKNMELEGSKEYKGTRERVERKEERVRDFSEKVQRINKNQPSAVEILRAQDDIPTIQDILSGKEEEINSE